MVTQSIHRPAGVNVFGSALIRVAPDYASLQFSVARLAPEPAKAFAEARAASKAVADFLRATSVPDADVASSSVTLAQETSFQGNERRFLGYRARVGFHVLLRELDSLEPVLVGAVNAGANVVESVELRTMRLKALRAEARRRAVHSARAKAEVYCAETGTRLGAVLHIEDVDPQEASRRGSHYAADVDVADADEQDAGRAWNPGHISVTAAVMICWAILA